MIDYRIDARQALAHRFTVRLTVKRPHPDMRFSLPVWIPGSYLVREFSRHLLNLKASQGARECTLEQTGKSSWQIKDLGRGALVLDYEVYANDTSVRAAFLDARRGFFNGTSVFLRVEHPEGDAALGDAPLTVRIEGLPKGWQVATALTPVAVDGHGVGRYEAADYDELVDHPVELGTFWRGQFKAKGVAHELVVAGAADDADLPRLMADTARLCEAQIDFWHGRRKPAIDRYVFMLNVVEEGYGGLEHRNSTALICARKDLPRRGAAPASKSSPPSEAYTTLLGLVSHEYFHTWNVKRLKPTAFDPYDYTRENHTDMLWFFEGFTSYYDDLFLLRTGLVPAATYLKLLGRPLNQVLGTPGRHVQSLAASSFDAWTRYYRPDENTANATVSYYTKGSLVALALDLSLRQCPAASDGRVPSLDGVMRRLWNLGRAIDHGDVAQALEAEATAPPTHANSWAELLARWVHGTDDLPLQALLKTHAIDWHSQPGSLAQQWGLRLHATPAGLKVQAVRHGSPGCRWGLSAGDELLSLDDWRLRAAEDLALWHRPDQTQTLLVCRDQRLMRLKVAPGTAGASAGEDADGHAVVALASQGAPAEAAQRRRRAWLGE